MEENATVTEIRPRRIRNFIEKHKTALTVVGTTVVTSTLWYQINRYALEQHDEFLREKDLYDEFYTDPSDAELQ